jgi:heme/copper-type cytochrome/quinol oxidase subunit 3
MAAPDTSTADLPDEEIERVPGEGDMWFFVLFESLVFTAYFCVYLYFRTQDERAASKRHVPAATPRRGGSRSPRSAWAPRSSRSSWSSG